MRVAVRARQVARLVSGVKWPVTSKVTCAVGPVANETGAHTVGTYGPGRGLIGPTDAKRVTPTSYRRREKRDLGRSGREAIGRAAARMAWISNWSLWPIGVRASHSR